MEKSQVKNVKVWSVVALLLALINIIGDIFSILQLKYRLVSDFIPSSAIDEIQKANIIKAIFAVSIGGIALFLHVKKKYEIVIILIILASIFRLYVLELIFI
jgi:hypothetical protein